MGHFYFFCGAKEKCVGTHKLETHAAGDDQRRWRWKFIANKYLAYSKISSNRTSCQFNLCIRHGVSGNMPFDLVKIVHSNLLARKLTNSVLFAKFQTKFRARSQL